MVSDGRILVVDDDPHLRGSIAMVLEDEGYTVELASDGQKALESVAANRPDVILLDVMMPHMSGTQVLKILQDDTKTADIPVLVMTAVNGMAGGRILNGPNEVVEKPFDVHDLLNKIALAIYRAEDNVDDRS
jgi:CheY-like chemotaxis protein